MSHARIHPVERLLHALPGWVLLLAGLGMIGSALLMPHWLDNRDLAWQAQLMREQSEQMREQEHDYRAFHEALVANDPVLLERLAFHQLRLKPSGAATLVRATAGSETVGQVTPQTLAIEAWLRRPLPQPGVSAPPRPIRSRLVRMSTGPGRLPFMIAGLAAVVMGLLLPLGSAEAKAKSPSAFAPTHDDTENDVAIVAEFDE